MLVRSNESLRNWPACSVFIQLALFFDFALCRTFSAASPDEVVRGCAPALLRDRPPCYVGIIPV